MRIDCSTNRSAISRSGKLFPASNELSAVTEGSFFSSDCNSSDCKRCLASLRTKSNWEGVTNPLAKSVLENGFSVAFMELNVYSFTQNAFAEQT